MNGSEQIRVSSLILNVEVSQVIRDILESFYVCVCVFYRGLRLLFQPNFTVQQKFKYSNRESEEKHIDIVKEYTQKKVKSYHSSN